ncbi:MAG: hypothetical protein AAGE65_06380 [Planctomycetota bacterium]
MSGTKSRSRKPRRKKLTASRAKAMLRDIFEARHDLSGLAEVYDQTPEQLSAWANDAGNRAVLRGLCELADLQTQLMLSRYRQLAVGELIRQATGEDERVTPEQARKACVDLLRADLNPPNANTAAEADASSNTEQDDLRALRDALFDQAEGGAS